MLLVAAALVACRALAPAPAPVPAPPAPNPDLVQRGAFLFLDPGLSGDGTRSCAGCHPGGGSDYRIYREGVEVAIGAEGGRRSLPLRGLWQTAPYLWDGSLETLRATIDRMLRVEMRGGTIRPEDAVALEAYLQSIRPFDRGRIAPDGAPREPATLTSRRGFELFREAGCPECHPPPAYTRPGLFDVASDGQWSAPTLRGVSVSGPYGHDGRWSSLERALSAAGHAPEPRLSSEELHRLLAYLGLL